MLAPGSRFVLYSGIDHNIAIQEVVEMVKLFKAMKAIVMSIVRVISYNMKKLLNYKLLFAILLYIKPKNRNFKIMLVIQK